MNSQTLKSGSCPKCGSGEVYTNKATTKRGNRMVIEIAALKRYRLDTYVCISCGQVEEYIPEEELKDIKLTEKIKENWNKVKL